MLKVNELFSGIGSQRAALERLAIEHEIIGIAEIDKYAIKSYEAIHGPVRNYGDISKIDKLDYADFWTYSFPCQDISVAGKQAGINENTRSGLLYQVERLLVVSKECGELPKYLMLENVKNLVGKKFKAQFDEWIQRLDELGYNTYWQVLNAKNYGIPQNRERVFAISVRKDIDMGYAFPGSFDNGKRLKDILEKEVDEKYYLSAKYTERFIKSTNSDKYPMGREYKVIGSTVGTGQGTNSRHWVYDTNDNMSTLDATMYKQPKQILVEGRINSSQDGIIISTEGLAPTHTAGNENCPKVLIPQATKQGYIECKVPGVADLSFPDSKTRRGRVQDNGEICPTLMTGQQDICYIDAPCIAASRGRYINDGLTEQKIEINQNGTSNTITTVQKDNYVLEPMENDQEYINNISDEYKFTKSKCQEMFDSNGCLPEMFNPYNKAEVTEIAPTQTTMCDRSCSSATVLIKQPQFRIRKLTPLECWRLMGFSDEQFYKAEKVNSNSQLYKQAGNSIVVDVLYYLFKNLFIDKSTVKNINDVEQLPGQMTIDDFIGG